MKSIFNRIMAAALAIGLPLAISSCKQEDEAKEATISLEITGTTTESITFEITTENAATYSYAFAKSADIAAAEYVTEDAQNGSAVKIERTGLEADTEYTVKAYASNADGKNSLEAVETATTTSAASVKIQEVSKTSSSITFRLVPMNAVSVSYAVADPDEDVESMELLNKSESGEEQEFTEEDLLEDTNYTIVATATNASGEESARSYLTVKTETEPVIEITGIVPSSDQASVTVSVANAAQFAWAYSEKGSGAPEKETFRKVTVQNEVNTFIISPLEESTDYTVYVYGITSGRYEGKIISENFTTTEYIEKPFEITVGNITSTDADVTVTFDKDIYSSYYFVIGSEEWIESIEDYDFENEYNAFFSSTKPILGTENMEMCISEFDPGKNLSLEKIYYIGGVPIKADGTVDESAKIWRQITLSPLVFGDASVTPSFDVTSTQMDNFTIDMDVTPVENLDCIYIGSVPVSEGDEDNAVRTLLGWSSSKVKDLSILDRDTTLAYRNPGVEYYVVLIAKDKDGRLNKAVQKVATKSVTDQGDATAQIGEPELGPNSAVFNVTFDPGTVSVLYNSQVKDEWFDENSFLRSLKVNNYNSISESGEISFDFLSAETNYVFGFCAVAEDGTLGKHYIIEASTSSYVFDGNQDAKVEIRLDGVTANAIYGYNVKFTAVPNEYVSKYYFAFSDTDNASYFTKASFVDQCMQGMFMEYSGEQSFTGWDGSGESCGPKATLWVLAVDTDGKLVPISETKIEGTGW